jgi:AraC-like DNA-binding protein
MLFYREYLPHPALRDIIHLYGVLGDNEVYTTEQVEVSAPVINKGLMFHYRRDGYLLNDNGRYVDELPRGFIMAQGTKPNVWKHTGGFAIFSVIFQPGKFRLLYKDPMLEFLDRPLTYDDYNDKTLLELQDIIVSAPNHNARIQAVDRYFLKKVRYLHPATDWLQNALQQMYLHPQYNIGTISKKVYKSESQLRKRFSRAFGISPKALQQLMRITHAVNLIGSGQTERLTDVAHLCGFTDQSHFTHQFKAKTGVAPLAFQKAQQNLTQLLTYREQVIDGYKKTHNHKPE